MAHFSLRFLAVFVFGLASARGDERWTNRGKVQPKRFWSFPTFKTPPQWQRGQLAKTYMTPDRKPTKWGWYDFKCAFGRCHSDGSILQRESPRAVATKPPQTSRPISKPAQPSPTRPKFRPPVATKQPRVYRPISCSSNEEVRLDTVHEMACLNVVAVKKFDVLHEIQDGFGIPDIFKDIYRELENLRHVPANSPTQQKCFCMAGFVRSYKGGPCVAASTCDTMCTGEYEAMSNVGADSTCQMHRPRITTPAVAKCLCLPGFVRSHEGCVPRSMCDVLNTMSEAQKQMQHSEQVVLARLRSIGVDPDMLMSIATNDAPTTEKVRKIMEEEGKRMKSGIQALPSNKHGMDPMMLALFSESPSPSSQSGILPLMMMSG